MKCLQGLVSEAKTGVQLSKTDLRFCKKCCSSHCIHVFVILGYRKLKITHGTQYYYYNCLFLDVSLPKSPDKMNTKIKYLSER